MSEKDAHLSLAIIGAGPAGLFAAEILSHEGYRVEVFERLAAPARRFLLAGRGGLNLTHSEPFADFIGHYGEAAPALMTMIEAFSPVDLRKWAESLGQDTFIGTSGRVFPKSMKASPLLRAWLQRLVAAQVQISTRHEWLGWDADGALCFQTDSGKKHQRFDGVILAMGGTAWTRLVGGDTLAPLIQAGIDCQPFQPANMGITLDFSPHFKSRFAGQALKNIGLKFEDQSLISEIMITEFGFQGTGIYALSRHRRAALDARRDGPLWIDLCPHLSLAEIESRLQSRPHKLSLSNYLRRAFKLSPAAIGLLHEDKAPLVGSRLKAFPLKILAYQGLDRAISVAGGIRFSALDKKLRLKGLPENFVPHYACGELLDWEAPTGGYLLQASFSTARHAAMGLIEQLSPMAKLSPVP